MSQSSVLRVGFIGGGANTRLRHLPGFQRIPGVELTAICNRSEESSQRVAGEFGIARISGNWVEIVDSPDIDAICIGTWPNMHAELTIAALKAGKHVLTEARMARNLEEAQAMLEASKRASGLVSQIVPAPMSFDLDAAAIRLVAEGRIGAIREVSITHTFGAYADDQVPHTWRVDSDISGRNTLMVGIYYEMVRRWVGVDPLKVLAHGSVFTKERKRADGSTAPVRIPESVTITGEYAGGGRFVGHFSGVESGTGRNELRINGSRGSIRGDLAANQLFHTPVGGAESLVEISDSERRGWRVEEDFVDSVRTGSPVRLTAFDDGIRYMRFTDAIYRSQEQGGVWIDLQ